MAQIFDGLFIPFRYEDGVIVDGAGKTVIKAERDSNKTPLAPYQRDALLKLVCELLNESMQYDHADNILKKLGY